MAICTALYLQVKYRASEREWLLARALGTPDSNFPPRKYVYILYTFAMYFISSLFVVDGIQLMALDAVYRYNNKYAVSMKKREGASNARL